MFWFVFHLILKSNVSAIGEQGRGDRRTCRKYYPIEANDISALSYHVANVLLTHEFANWLW